MTLWEKSEIGLALISFFCMVLCIIYTIKAQVHAKHAQESARAAIWSHVGRNPMSEEIAPETPRDPNMKAEISYYLCRCGHDHAGTFKEGIQNRCEEPKCDCRHFSFA